MWQYTDSGEVDGIYGYVDLNIANFAYQEVNKTIQQNIPSSEIQPGPTEEPASEAPAAEEPQTSETPSNYSDRF